MAQDDGVASFTFLHAADIHLDSPLRGLSRYDGVPTDEVRGATRAAFDRLIEAAIERQVDFVILAGDLYDGDWRDMGTGLYFSAAMGRLGRAGIPVYLLAGNHDAASVITKALPALENVHTFSTKKPATHRLPQLDVAIHGRSFADRETFENLAVGYPAAEPGVFNIGVLHTALGGYAAHANYAPCSEQDLVAKGYDYWALGHVHEHAVLRRDPYIVFPGNLQGRNIREQGAKGAVLVVIEDGHIERVTHLPLDVVRWARVGVDASAASDLDELYGRIRTALRAALDGQADDRPLMVRLALSGPTELHGRLQDVGSTLRDDVRSLAAETSEDLWLEKIEVRTTAPLVPANVLEADDLEELLPEFDDSLLEALRTEFAPFLAGVAPEADSLVAEAADGNWATVLDVASAALRARLNGSR
jgi:exonuclease SbcD